MNKIISTIAEWWKVIWSIIKTHFVYGILNCVRSVILYLTGFTAMVRNVEKSKNVATM